MSDWRDACEMPMPSALPRSVVDLEALLRLRKELKELHSQQQMEKNLKLMQLKVTKKMVMIKNKLIKNQQ